MDKGYTFESFSRKSFIKNLSFRSKNVMIKKNEKPKEKVSKVFDMEMIMINISKILTRSFWGVISMFLSFTGFMSENFIHCFIAFCIGGYLLYPLLKCCNKDIRSQILSNSCFLIFAISLM